MERRLDQPGLARRLLPSSDPRLRQLAEKRPLRVAVDIARAYALMLGSFILLSQTRDVWAMVLCFFIIGTQQYALYIIGHDGMHGNVARRRSLNDAITTGLLLAPLGTRVGSGRQAHLTHHRYLGSDGDPDRPVHLMRNKSTLGSFVLFLSGLTSLPSVLARLLPWAKPAAKTKADVIQVAIAGEEPPAPALSGLRARWPALIAQAVIFGLIATFLPFWYYFVFWMLPVYALVYLTDQIRAFCEHAQPALSESDGDPRRLVTFVPNFLERTVFAPQSMNYHAEHHLWPFIPYYNLPRAHALIKHSPDVEIRTSYVGFIWKQLRRLLLERGQPIGTT